MKIKHAYLLLVAMVVLCFTNGAEGMMIKQVLVVKETREGETRVALTPETISSLSSRQYQLLVESGAGLKAGFTDSDYVNAGAEIFFLSPEGFPADTLVLRVKRPDKTRQHLENKLFHENTSMMGFLDPLDADDHVIGWQQSSITTFSMDLFKSLSINDPKNMQAAMSRIAGRLAFQDGLKRYNGEKSVKLTVIGTGPAAFSAAFEARKAGIPVQVFGKQERYRAELETAGIFYYTLPEPAKHIEFIRQYLKEETIVITAARTPRVKAPLLIDEESLHVLPKGAVIIDLAVNEGGSVVGGKSDQVVVSNGVSIAHVSGYPKLEPRAASEAYAKCLINLLAEVLSPQGELLLEHELLRECWVTHDGKCNPSLTCSPKTSP
jgi:NAD(P) transhydrogenase subunit alpha